jgi:hypothetical protein
MKSLLLLMILLLSGCTAAPPASHETAGASQPHATSTSSSPAASTATSGTTSGHPGTPTSHPSSTTSERPPTGNSSASVNATPQPREWGAIPGKEFRPGIEIGNGSCTTSFLFQLNWSRFFFGSSGHCFNTPAGTQQLCSSTDAVALGSPVLLNGRTGSQMDGVLVYDSITSMVARGEADAAACQDNDFALIEIPATQLDSVHPAVLYYGGPIALDNLSLQPDQDVYFFGHSGTRNGQAPGVIPILHSEVLDPQHLVFRNYLNGGWNFNWEAIQDRAPDTRTTDYGPIPGDSGGPFLGPTGNALANLGGGARNLHLELDYMRQHEGWAPSLVTWQDFSPSGIEPVRPV